MGPCRSTWIYSVRIFTKDHVVVLLNVLHIKLLGQNQNLFSFPLRGWGNVNCAPCLINHRWATNSLPINQSVFFLFFFGDHSWLKDKTYMGNCLTFHVNQRLLLNIYCRFYQPLNTDYTDDKQIDLHGTFTLLHQVWPLLKTPRLTVSPSTAVHSMARCEVLLFTTGTLGLFKSNYTIETFNNFQFAI